MRRLRIFLTIVFIFVLIWHGEIETFAMDTGFSTETLSEDEEKTVLKNVNISLFNSEYQKDSIVCFDVNSDGLIAVGCSDGEKKTIAVYTIDGIFKYGYKFKSSGSFGLEWDKDNIIIYFVRSDLAVAVSPEGEIEEILKIQNTLDNNTYWNHSVFLTERKTDDYKYIMKNNMGFLNWFASSYSQLIAIDSDGSTMAVYDVSFAQLVKYIILLIGAVLFILFVILMLKREFIKLNKKG